jgi:hypothetical protein
LENGGKDLAPGEHCVFADADVIWVELSVILYFVAWVGLSALSIKIENQTPRTGNRRRYGIFVATSTKRQRGFQNGIGDYGIAYMGKEKQNQQGIMGLGVEEARAGWYQ